MIIDCISDLHGHYPKLDGGDLLIVAGDLTARDTPLQMKKMYNWMWAQKYKKVIFIAGNHDNNIDHISSGCESVAYLCDSGTEFEGLKIWGSPWTRNFVGMNPHCKAFGLDTDEDLTEKWALIPDDIDILITHSPPYNILDWNSKDVPCGSRSLLIRARDLHKLKLFVFGHIHEAYGKINLSEVQQREKLSFTDDCPLCLPIVINASIMDQAYDPVNKPIRVNL